MSSFTLKALVRAQCADAAQVGRTRRRGGQARRPGIGTSLRFAWLNAGSPSPRRDHGRSECGSGLQAIQSGAKASWPGLRAGNLGRRATTPPHPQGRARAYRGSIQPVLRRRDGAKKWGLDRRRSTTTAPRSYARRRARAAPRAGWRRRAAGSLIATRAIQPTPASEKLATRTKVWSRRPRATPASSLMRRASSSPHARRLAAALRLVQFSQVGSDPVMNVTGAHPRHPQGPPARGVCRSTTSTRPKSTEALGAAPAGLGRRSWASTRTG